MNPLPLDLPLNDPTSLFQIYRGKYGTALLVAASHHLDVFGTLASHALTFEEASDHLELSCRAGIVLFVALRALGLLATDSHNRLMLTPLAQEYLVTGASCDLRDYLALEADSPAVMEMVNCLRTSRPANISANVPGAAYIYRSGIESAMENAGTARRLTLSLAGIAKSAAPLLAQRTQLQDARILLDVGGGTGIYSIACLQQYPHLRAVVLDRPEVLEVTKEFAALYGVSSRLDCVAADMFSDPLPEGCDVILLSHVLHDWDVPECRALIQRCSAALHEGGSLLIHEVFLNDTLDGPLWLALHSAALFCLTQGRAYSAREIRNWLSDIRFAAGEVIPTLANRGVLMARTTSS